MTLTPADFRLDRRTSGTIRCKPPNRRCGDRCIPPSWDCRLKGEGNDNHLKAAGTGSDPLAGFANLERGISRIGKGALKLSFAEVEGGRRAIARGAAKLSPGDLQKKKELQQTVYNYGIAVGAPLTVAIFAALSHKGLKSFRGYREGPGRQIDEVAGNAMRTVARNMPFGAGENYRRREAAGVNSVRSQANALSNLEAGGLAGVSRRASTGNFLRRTAAAQRAASTTNEGVATVHSALNKVDLNEKGQPSKLGYIEWEDRSLQAFWGTPRTAAMVPDWVPSGSGSSLFGLVATNDLISRSFNITPKPALPLKTQTLDVVNNIAINLRKSGEEIATSMRQAGLNPTSPQDVSRYIRSVPLDSGIPESVRGRLYDTLEVAVVSKDYTTQAKSFYSNTLRGFDQFFGELSSSVIQRPSINNPQRDRSFWRDGTLAHAEVLARRIGFDVGPINDTGLAAVVKKAYHGSRVWTNKRVFKTDVILTRTEALTAASELARSRGMQEPSNATDAISLLNDALGGGNEAQRPTRVRSFSLVQAPAPERPTPPAAPPAAPRAARRRSEAARIADIRRERNPDGTPRYPTIEAAQAELRRRQGRTDALRRDYTDPSKRTGKPCGKSFVPRARKCSKPTSRGYADKPRPQAGSSPRERKSYPAGYIPKQIKRSHKVSKETEKDVGSIAERAAKVAAVAGVVAGGVAVARNRKPIGAAIKKSNPELYRQASVRARLAGRSAQRAGRQVREQAARTYNRAQLVTGITTINALSSKQIQDGLNKVPQEWQSQVRSLVGKAKVGAAAMVLRADSSTLIDVDVKNNFSTFKHVGGHYLTIGSVDDSLLLFRSHSDTPIDTGGGQKAGRYIMDFTVDLKNSQKENLTPEQSSRLVRSTKAMFNKQVEQIPDNSLISVTAYKDDGIGDKRTRVYNKWGFRALPNMNQENLWAVKREGKFSKFEDDELDGVAWLLKQNESRSDRANTKRLDKRCGKSGIPAHRKCHVPTAPPSASVTETARQLASNRAVQIGAGAAAVGSALLFHKHLRGQRRIEKYRANVAKSAIEAEKLAKEYERSFREDAAVRLKKPVQEVTGFEASVYNFKDKGYDRGFGGFDSSPEYFGQTPNSRGAVVMLSYADDGRHTTRGQGSFKMATSGAFNKIWGEHDIMPYANNISQPNKTAPDDLDNLRFNKLADKIESVLGEPGRSAAETLRTLTQIPGRFEYLRANVDSRGFNPDSVRIAAFVAAQRRLTGKPVHMMSYSNGGSAATEALAILSEMGYRDVKVVNVAGPTFGIFSHKPENMQTWVSEGDEFWKMSGGRAFQGSRVNKLTNDKIPHGLMEGIDPNDPRTGSKAKENVKAKNSYLLDEQLQREAYTFLTVDKKRSQELIDEVVWRATTDKPPEGDIGALYGSSAAAKLSEYKRRLFAVDGEAKAAVKEDIRSEIEERMIETWYGGYKPAAVKRRARELRADLKKQAQPAADS